MIQEKQKWQSYASGVIYEILKVDNNIVDMVCLQTGTTSIWNKSNLEQQFHNGFYQM